MRIAQVLKSKCTTWQSVCSSCKCCGVRGLSQRAATLLHTFLFFDMEDNEGDDRGSEVPGHSGEAPLSRTDIQRIVAESVASALAARSVDSIPRTEGTSRSAATIPGESRIWGGERGRGRAERDGSVRGPALGGKSAGGDPP